MTETKPESVAYEISEHPFLRGLSPGFLESISIGATPHTYTTDEFLLREGEEANLLFLIYSGKVALEVTLPDRPRLTIETVGTGDVVGWSWSVAPRRYEHDARALKTTRAISTTAACCAPPARGTRPTATSSSPACWPSWRTVSPIRGCSSSTSSVAEPAYDPASGGSASDLPRPQRPCRCSASTPRERPGRCSAAPFVSSIGGSGSGRGGRGRRAPGRSSRPARSSATGRAAGRAARTRRSPPSEPPRNRSGSAREAVRGEAGWSGRDVAPPPKVPRAARSAGPCRPRPGSSGTGRGA